jgi:hypothetical protein
MYYSTKSILKENGILMIDEKKELDKESAEILKTIKELI